MNSHTIRIDGAETHYLEGGSKGRDTVVLVHDGAFGADGAATWGPLLGPLAEKYHVLVPDMLGFGGTDKIYDFASGARSQKIDHLTRWLKALDVEEAHFVGNSNGGSLVLLAAISTVWPIVKAVSIAGTGGPFMSKEGYTPLRNYVPDEEAMRSIVELLVSRRDDVFDQLVKERYQKSLLRGHWEALSAARLKAPVPKGSPGERKTDGFFEGLSSIRSPVMLVGGSNDALLEPRWEEKLAASIPDARTLLIDGARHQPHLDEPDTVLAALYEFFDG